MSGVFMDGGGADGGGSFMHGGTIDSTSFMNGGGGDGYLHVHTGEGMNQAPVMDTPNHFDHRLSGSVSGSSSGFLAHLLGLDQHQPQPQGAAPKKTGLFGSGLKLSDLIQGMSISPGFGMLLVFLGFIGWLFVVYFIRHHEPMAEQVLGKAPPASGVYADRSLMNQVRHAMPLQISHDSGTVYEPLPGGQLSTVDAVNNPPQLQTRYAPSRFNDISNYSPPHYSQGNYASPAQFAQPQFASPQFMSGAGLNGYNMAAMQTPTGPKVKMIVNH